MRLYPLYLVGLLLAIVVLAASAGAQNRLVGGAVLDWRALPFAVLAAPSPFARDLSEFVYPLNFPAWSLFFEFAVNLVYALTWRWWTLATLPVAIVVSGALLFVFGGDGDMGWSWAGFPVGLLRCGYAFPFGVLIYKLQALGIRAPQVPGVLCLAAFSLLLLTPATLVVPVAVLAGAPLLVLFAASAKTSPLTGRLFLLAGSASYALYAIHVPLMNAARVTLERLPVHPDAAIVGFAFLAAAIPLCLLLDRYVDDPARRLLTRLFLGEERRPARLSVAQTLPAAAAS